MRAATAVVAAGGVVYWLFRDRLREALFQRLQDGLHELAWRRLPKRYPRHGSNRKKQRDADI
jgi:hypothetical protein